MAERGTEKMTEWLDIKLETLSSEERLHLIPLLKQLHISPKKARMRQET